MEKLLKLFAETNVSVDAAAVIVGITALLGGVYAFVKGVLNQATEDRKEDRKDREHMTRAIERMAVASETAAREAEQRNGHLAEISIQNKDAILKAIKNISLNQQVTEQHVDQQTISKQIKE